MRITTLSDLNDAPLFLMCTKEGLLPLTKDWAQLLTNYPIFCDIWSDVIEAKGSALNFLKMMDERGESAFAAPAAVSGVDRYLLLFSGKYFLKPYSSREGIIMHELGHFYVYRKRFLEQLGVVLRDAGVYFSQFIAPILNFYEGWATEQKQWIKNFFDSYVLDILKVPGEIFANLWLKENFKEMFAEVFKGQLEAYKMVLRGKEKIHETLIKFPAFSLILRLNGLSILAQDVTELEEEKKALEIFDKSLRKTLMGSARQNETVTFFSFEESIIEASCSFEAANSTLPQIFGDLLIKIPLRPEDFVS
jgi:hypothetical protein